MKKRVWSAIFCLCLIFALLPTAALADEAPQGAGTREDPYQIGTAEELKWFRDLVNDREAGDDNDYYRDISAELTDDIDLNPGFTFNEDGTVDEAPYPGAVPESWEPIGKKNFETDGNGINPAGTAFYSGSFDGKGHTISGLYIQQTEQTGHMHSYGLFGVIGGQSTDRDYFASLKNLTVEGTVILALESGDAYDTDSTVTQCIGILSGKAEENSEIFDCTSEGRISINKYSGTRIYAGGVCGSATGDVYIKSCTNSARLDIAAGLEAAFIGGVCGSSYSVPPSGCGNSGDITVTRGERWGTEISELKCGGVTGNVLSSTGELYGCFNTGKITVKSASDSANASQTEMLCVGGIAGYGRIAKITDCYNTGDVSVQGAYETDAAASELFSNFVSGIAGSFMECTQMERCFNSGSIAFTASGGSEDVSAEILKYTSVTELIGATRVSDITFANCFTSGKRDACQIRVKDATKTIKIAGTAYGDKLASGELAYLFHGDGVSLSNIWGQKIGLDAHPVFSSDVVHKHDDDYVNAATDEAGACADCGIIDAPKIYTCTPVSSDSADYYEFFISNAAQFQWIREFQETITVPIRIHLLNDITFNTGTITAESTSADKWEPLSTNEDSGLSRFDGHGYSVSGVYCVMPDDTPAGLFGTWHGNIQNLTLKNSYIEGGSVVGGICGTCYGTISNCENAADVHSINTGKSWSYVGGICGEFFGSTISNSINSGAVTSNAQHAYIAGIAGYCAQKYGPQQSITGCKHTGKVYVYCTDPAIYGSTDYDITVSGNVGGLVGGANVSGFLTKYIIIKNCINDGEIIIKNIDVILGGMVGQGCVQMDNCKFSGSITVSNSKDIFDEFNGIGGLVGWRLAGGDRSDPEKWVNIRNSCNTGKITYTGAAQAMIGGLVGMDDTEHYLCRYPIENCYSTGEINTHLTDRCEANTANPGMFWVEGNFAVGGIIGCSHFSGSKDINNCYSMTKIRVTAESDEIFEAMESDAENNYVNLSVNGIVGWWYTVMNPSTGYHVYSVEDVQVPEAMEKIMNNKGYSQINSISPGFAVGVTKEQMASGEIAWKLNGESSEPAEGETLVWYQTLGTDLTPQFEGATVLYDAARTPPYYNEGVSYAISAAPKALSFGSVSTGYAQPAAQEVTVTNAGSESVTVDLPTLANYTITAGEGFTGSVATLAANGSAATFTVRPDASLGAETYNGTITISGSNNVSDTVAVSFAVQTAPVTKHTVTVTGGTGGGSYAEGETVTITAAAPAAGKHFKSWVISPAVTFVGGASVASATAKFTMPAEAVNAEATYETDAATPTISFATQPAASTVVTVGSIAASDTLTASAEVSPSGAATLNWYACDSAGTISGNALGTGGTFQIPTNLTTGTYYYLCQATYTGAAAADSNVATVTVNAASSAFVPVTGIVRNFADTVAAGADLTLAGTAQPGNATKQTIVWSVSPNDAGATGASVSNGVFTATTAGTATVRATIVNGAAETENYVQDYTIAISSTPVATHTISVGASPSAGGTASGGGAYGENVSVTVTAVANANYHFVEWTENGSRVSTNASYSFPATESRTLVAVFEADAPATYPVTINGSYAANNGAGNYSAGETVNIYAGNRSGYRFSGWTVESGSVMLIGSSSKNASFLMPGSAVTVKANWTYNGGGYTPSTYTLTFNVGGGSAISGVSKTSGATVDLTSYKPTKDGYDFDGWYTSSSLTTKVTSVKLISNTTVYAKWTEKAVTPDMPFVDVADDAYYRDAVIWALAEGVTEGADAATFAPNGICTRAQAVTFLWRANGSPAHESTAMPFGDVPAGSYYYNAVLWAVEQDIVKGTSSAAFSPDMKCSRAQIVTMLWRANGSKPAPAAKPFADVSSSAYYADAVLWAVAGDITSGTADNTFSPDADCTRAQIVTFIYRNMR